MAITDEEWERICRSAYEVRAATAIGSTLLVNYLTMANAGHCTREHALMAAASSLAETADTLAARLTDAIANQPPPPVLIDGKRYEYVGPMEPFRTPMDKATGR